MRKMKKFYEQQYKKRLEQERFLFTHEYRLDKMWKKDDKLECFNKVPTCFQMVLTFVNHSRAILSNRNVF